MSFLHNISQDIRSTPENIFESLRDNDAIRKWFPELHVTETNTDVDLEKLRTDNIQYIVRIDKKIPYSSIAGTVESIDNSVDKLNFEWKLEQNPDQQDWTHLTMDFAEPLTIIKSRWWAVPIVGTISILTLLSTGSANMSSAYAATAVSSAAIQMPLTSNIAAMSVKGAAISKSASSIAGSGMITSKTILAAIIASVIVVTGGVTVTNAADPFDPYVKYSLYPAQLPAELHGTELRIDGIYSNGSDDDVSSYVCDVEPIIYGLEYSFDCIVTNTLGYEETVKTVVPMKPPGTLLDATAMDCVSRHDVLANDVTDDYPYLLNLPIYSPSKLVSLKKDHIKMMDNSFENRDYTSAKKHAMIILKYFNGSDIQTLSTLGNTMRDEDRQNMDNIQCAVEIHSTPFIRNTSWGTLSLAEDHHVLGNFEMTSQLASSIIDRYELYGESEFNPIEKTTYKNAMIIKANALFRIVMADQTKDPNEIENVKKYYVMANEIQNSYDTWFGLGNLDRYVGNFEDALENYEKARDHARDTTEIDNEIGVMKSYL